jgi:hypothetical protein
MVIECDNENVIIKIDPSLIGMDEVQKTIDYLRILESNAQNKGTQEEAAALAREINKGWWDDNKHRFLK